MSLPVLIGFTGVLVAAVATGVLAGQCVRQPRTGLILWTAATLVLAVALAVQSKGFASGFNPAMFRAVQLLELLLAPLWLAWGLAELAWPSEAARFGARLICTALTVVGGVILATEPLTGSAFKKSWPPASVYYQPFSHYALDLTQAAAVVIAAVSVGLAAAGARNDRRDTGTLIATAAVGLAVVLIAGLRFSLPDRSGYPLVGMLAAVLVWFGATKVGDQPGQRGDQRAVGEVDSYDIPGVEYALATNGHRRPAEPDGPGDLQESSRRPVGPGAPGRPGGTGQRGESELPGAPYGLGATGKPDAPRRPGEPRGPSSPPPRQRPTPQGPDRYRGGAGPDGPGPDGRRPPSPDTQRAQLAGAATAAAAAVASAAGAGRAGTEADAGRPASSAGASATAPARPYGRIVIFTLLEDQVADFDRLADQTADEVRIREPDTLVFVIHLVPNAPLQRIFYEIYRDQAAFDSHENQPYIQRFAADRRSYVLATNVIELGVKYAKVAPLPSSQPSSPRPLRPRPLSPQPSSPQPSSPQPSSPQPSSPRPSSLPPPNAAGRPGTRSQLPPVQSQGTRRPQALEPLPPGPDRRQPAAGRPYGGI